MDNPLVSICCLVYNHGSYLKQCLDGFVMQQTSFSFEIIVHDDASTDNSQEIILDYQQRFPKLFRPILQKENQFSKNSLILINFVFPNARGKYIALCEGDDYWIDPYKLQKQVDFLENTPQYSLICSGAKVFFQNSACFKGIKGTPQCERFDTIVLGYNDINTASVLMRKEILEDCIEDLHSFLPNELIIDTAYWYWFAQKGLVKYIPEPMSVYRVLEESACHTKDENKRLYQAISFLKLKLYFLTKYPISPDQQNDIVNSLVQEIKELCDYSRFLGDKYARNTKTFRIASNIRKLRFWK